MRVEILEEAAADLLEGFAFYEKQRAGLGHHFLDNLEAEIDTLESRGGIHAQYLGYYRLVSKRFPFAIFYRLAGDTVKIHAILDCRRDPQFIEHRLRE